MSCLQPEYWLNIEFTPASKAEEDAGEVPLPPPGVCSLPWGVGVCHRSLTVSDPPK